jgi:hypothetical protein
VTAPVASTVYSGNSGAVVTWQDNEITPSLALFGPATISIYAGNALQQVKIKKTTFLKNNESNRTLLDESASPQ